MERAVEIWAAIHCLIMGLSHVFQPRAWADFFILLRGKGHAGVFVNGFLSLWFGSIIVAFHNVWEGLPIILTLLGWSQVLKAALSFTIPAYATRSLNRVSPERAWEFQIAGTVLLVLGGLFLFLALRPVASS